MTADPRDSTTAGKAAETQDRPLILVVCEDPERLAAHRQLLREAGFLPASGRAVEAAVGLLSQVRVDGCVICQPVTADEAARLLQALERVRPACPKLYVQDYQCERLDGWTVCIAGELAESVRAAFRR